MSEGKPMTDDTEIKSAVQPYLVEGVAAVLAFAMFAMAAAVWRCFS